MDWFRTHPYTLLIALVAILFLAGAYIVKERATVSPNPASTIAWGGGGGFLQPTTGIQNQNMSEPPDLYRRVQSSAPFWYPALPTQNAGEAGGGDSFDLDAFLALLSPVSPQEPSTKTEAPADNFFADAYSFIPRGLIATSTPAKERTPAQDALYAYGNEAGSYIQVFEERNRDMARVLKDQFEDKQNPEKRAALLGLADSLAGVGDSLLSMESVPQQAAPANKKLAESYRAMGAKLRLVPNARTDEELVQAMLAYNATAEEFVKSYVAMVTLFSLSEVTFRSDESGSVFVFTVAGF